MASITAQDCALKIRLFDGRTISSRFPSTQTLRSHVRPWIEQDENYQDIPFDLKQVLTPLPNRLISISEEDQSLQAVGLTPSANLIMIPVKAFTTSYDKSPNYISRSLSYIYGIVSNGAVSLGKFIGPLGMSTSNGPIPSSEINSSSPMVTQGTSSGFNAIISELNEQEDQQLLYNGNQVFL